jgi:FAS-associated factor 2
MEVDDSNVQHGPPATSGSTPPFLSLIGRLIAFPLVTTFNVLGYVFRLLRIPVPRLNLNFNWSIFSSLFTPPKRENPGVAAERWVRELEAEVGGRRLPEFYLGSYEDALSVARRELRIMCVVLVSEEHDDVPVFKRCEDADSTLCHVY